MARRSEPGSGTGGLDGFEQLAGADVSRRMPQLRHRTGLDLTDALPGEAEVLGHFLERALAATVEPEAQREDRALALVEHRKHLGYLAGQQARRRVLEGRDRVAVLDEVAELGVAVVADGFVERHVVDGMDEAEIALLDDVEQREPRALVLLRDRHDEPQVRVDELAVCFLTLTDLAPKLTPLRGRELLRGLEPLVCGGAGFDRLREPA